MAASVDDSLAGVDEERVCDDYCSYEEFGVRFFEHAVTPARIHAAMSGLVGNLIEFGPKAVGPGRVARITATGRIGDVTVTQRPGHAVTFRLMIPVDLHLTVRLAGQNHRFHAEMRAGLTLTARAAAPLRIRIDIAPPSADDVEVIVRAKGLRATALRAAADVDGELRRFVARYIGREIDKPHIRQVCDIDVAARIDKAWSGRGSADGEGDERG